MKRVLVAVFLAGFAWSAAAQHVSELNPNARLFMVKGWARPGGGGGQNLAYHNGPVINSASVVCIFWGPTWSDNSHPDSQTASTIINFMGQFGTSFEYNTITQYYDGSGNIARSNLGTTAWFDSSAPPTNVTDSAIQGEVSKYLQTHGADANTIYEVYLPASSYSSYGTSTSCGGPNLTYCAYHGSYNHNGVDVKYASMPNPSCAGCRASGFSVAQDFTMFASHETREAVTDPDGTAWYDRRGYEADDKCAWTDLFVDNGYGYQPEWSNAVKGCVRTTPY